MSEYALIILVLVLALSFDFINGFHDTANAIATSVTTRALEPKTAILLAAIMNLAGALLFTGVAKTVGGKIVDPMFVGNGVYIVVAALLSAITWNLYTWFFGIPSSSSHALLGSLVGAAIASAGFKAVNLYGFIAIVGSLILSPLVAFTVGYIIMSIITRLYHTLSPHKANTRFRTLQVLAALFQSFSHGTNDAQKTMGIITFALVAGGYQQELEISLWVKLAAALALAMGTYVGGWRIIKTVGTRITRLEPSSGFASDFTSAMIIICATLAKLPVSTTHVISSAIMGVGSSTGFSNVNWHTVVKLIIAWLMTLPITMLLAALLFLTIDALGFKT